jgi:hypothetical protein
MSDMDRFKYSVTPYTPIKDLIPGKLIMRPFSADLDKEEVFICMKHGPVYRLFVGKAPIKVTGENFPLLHRATPGDEITATKYNYTVIDENVARATEEVTEPMKTDAPTEVEPASEEVIDETEVSEEPAEEVEAVPVEEEVVAEEDADDQEEVVEDETVEEEITAEPVSAPQPQNNNNHNRNKKRKH